MKRKSKTKFISYDGEYPTLCMGKLKVSIGGKKITFGCYSEGRYSKELKDGGKYRQFWNSGGSVSFSRNWEEKVTRGEWVLGWSTSEDYPKEIYDRLPELIDLFNENVQQGCCGGCV